MPKADFEPPAYRLKQSLKNAYISPVRADGTLGPLPERSHYATLVHDDCSAHLRDVAHGVTSVCYLPMEIDLDHDRRAAAFEFA